MEDLLQRNYNYLDRIYRVQTDLKYCLLNVKFKKQPGLVEHPQPGIYIGIKSPQMCPVWFFSGVLQKLKQTFRSG